MKATGRKRKLGMSDRLILGSWIFRVRFICTCDYHSACICCSSFFYGSKCIEQSGNQL